MSRKKPGKSKRTLTEREQRLWQDVTRSFEVTYTPLVLPSPEFKPPASQTPSQTEKPKMTQGASSKAMWYTPPELDRHMLKALKSGKRRPEAVLDLHGMSLQKAHHAVKVFVQTSRQRYGRRCVLVITGKGRGGGQGVGVLRREVPLWLRAPGFREHVSQISPAHPKDGGQGAIYVYLTKPKGQSGI